MRAFRTCESSQAKTPRDEIRGRCWRGGFLNALSRLSDEEHHPSFSSVKPRSSIPARWLLGAQCGQPGSSAEVVFCPRVSYQFHHFTLRSLPPGPGLSQWSKGEYQGKGYSLRPLPACCAAAPSPGPGRCFRPVL